MKKSRSTLKSCCFALFVKEKKHHCVFPALLPSKSCDRKNRTNKTETETSSTQNCFHTFQTTFIKYNLDLTLRKTKWFVILGTASPWGQRVFLEDKRLLWKLNKWAGVSFGSVPLCFMLEPGGEWKLSNKQQHWSNAEIVLSITYNTGTK